AGEFATFVAAIGGRMSKHPCALYWGGIDFSDPRHFVPKLALICNAGPDAAALAQELQSAIDKIGRPPAPIKVTATPENLVLLTIGPAAVPAPPQKALGNDALFKDVMTKVQDKPVLAAFVDTAGIVRLLDSSPVKGK